MTPPERRPFLAWPGWAHLQFAGWQTLWVSLWFGIVFVGADWFTRQRAWHVRVHLDAELHLPLIPAFTLVYLSIYGLFFIAPFVLRTRREISMLVFSQALAIAIAGICFLLIPAQLAYLPPTDAALGGWKPWYAFAHRWALDYNLVPSLHVALSTICIAWLVLHAGRSGQLLLRSWGLLIAASTVFTHQHHLLDVLAGYALALVVLRIVNPRQH